MHFDNNLLILIVYNIQEDCMKLDRIIETQSPQHMSLIWKNSIIPRLYKI